MKPRTRREGLVVQELPDELLVYDKRSHKAHCLNPAAALVFKHADGRTSVAQLARRLRDEVDGAADEAWVRLALDRLRRAQLLESPAAGLQSPTRRELLRKAGIAAATLPAVATVLAPTPAAAVATCVTNCSGQANGTPCASSQALCGGTICICVSGVCCDPGDPGCPGTPSGTC